MCVITVVIVFKYFNSLTLCCPGSLALISEHAHRGINYTTGNLNYRSQRAKYHRVW